MNIFRVLIDGFFAREDWFIEALGILEPGQITDLHARAVYKVLRNEYYNGGAAPDIRTFPDLVARKYKEKVAEVLCKYVLAHEHMEPDRAVFKHAVQMVLFEGKKAKVRENVTKGLGLLEENKVHGITEVLIDGLDAYDQDGSEEVNSRLHMMEFLAEQQTEAIPGIEVGIPELDKDPGGIRPGDLWIWAAYTSECKTTCMMEMTYHMVTHGHNVGWITVEMEVDEMQEMFVLRNAHKFNEGGLDSTAMQQRLLDADEYKILEAAAMDWKDNPEYGNMPIWKPARSANLNTIESKVRGWVKALDLEVLVVDYLEPIPAVRKRVDYRIEVKEKTAQLKRLGSDLGIGVITGHQISRAGREKAEKRSGGGHYILGDLSESSGVEQNAKVVAWSLMTEEMEMNKELRWGSMKNRRGGKARRGFDVKTALDRGRIYFREDDGEDPPF